MEIRRLKIHVIIISFLVVLGLGTAARGYLYNTRVLDPLQRRLDEVPGAVEIMVAPARRVVQLAAGRSVQLSQIVPTVQDVLRSQGEGFALEILEEPGVRNLEALGKMMFAVEQAVALGTFEELEPKLQQIAADFGQRLVLAVDRNYVYIQLSDEQGYVNRVISRGGAAAVPTIPVTGVSR